MTKPNGHIGCIESAAPFAGADLTGMGITRIQRDPSDSRLGTVQLYDGSELRLGEVERLIPCFTPGTGIATPRGEVPVEQLAVGHRVITRDNGIRTINWVGKKRLDHMQLKALPALRPILIRAGALGPDLPDRDMMVSPSHRMLLVSDMARRHFGQAEVLVAAKDLCGIDGIDVAEVAYVTYIHFLCETHELVLADGAWSESFQPGDYSTKGLDQDQREELFALFPEFATKEGIKSYRAARPTLKRDEVGKILTK